MQEFFSRALGTFENLGGDVLSMVPSVAVILIVVVIRRALGWQSQRASGSMLRGSHPWRSR